MLIAVGAVLRSLLLVYSAWHDRHSIVKYTDVDYRVYSDAAKRVMQDGSPYDRATYRYSPLIAWMLLPNEMLSPLWGKAR